MDRIGLDSDRREGENLLIRLVFMDIRKAENIIRDSSFPQFWRDLQGEPVQETQPTVSNNWGCIEFLNGYTLFFISNAFFGPGSNVA